MITGRTRRSVLYVLSGLVVLLAPWLGSWGMFGVAAGMVFLTVAVLPGLPWTRKAFEADEPFLSGLRAYSLAVAGVTLFFPLPVACLVWGILAFGGGGADFVDEKYGKHRLSWNAEKSIERMVSLLVFGIPAGFFLMGHAGGWSGAAAAGPALTAASIAGLLAAAADSVHIGVDDDLSAGIAAGLGGAVVFGYFQRLGQIGLLPQELLAGIVVILVLSGVARLAGAVDASGLWAAFGAGALIFASTGYRGAAVVAVTLMVVWVLSLIRGEWKKNAISGRDAGMTAARVLGKACVPVFFAVLYFVFGEEGGTKFMVAFAGALAAAFADSVETEVGMAASTSPRKFPFMAAEMPGTAGAMSLRGITAGLVAAFGIAVLLWAMGLLGFFRFWVLPLVALGALAGTVLESLVASLAGRHYGREWGDLVCTAAGGGGALLLTHVVQAYFST